jgi:ppGpp synthetase/RelA/SpoT-type nucleotidyltranferase
VNTVVSESVRRYAERQAEVQDVARRLAAWLTTVLDDAGINYLNVSWRAKSVASFAAKTGRRTQGRPTYPDPLRDITDQIGVRIVTYVSSDVAAVAGLIAEQVHVIDDRDLGQQTASAGNFGYVSRHLQVALDPVWLGEQGAGAITVASAQVQLRTVLQHAWAQFEHDIRYKGTVPPELAPDLDRRFTLAAGLLELADREFQLIHDRMHAPSGDVTPDADPLDPRIGEAELAAFLGRKFPDAGWSRTDHYTWMSGLLLELGVTSLRELESLLGAVDSAAITERMGYKYPPGAVRRLDDALLVLFGSRYPLLHGNAHRAGLLNARLEKLA